MYKDETIWATQTAMGELFGCSSDNIGVHLKNIYTEGELLEAATTEKISVVQLEGSRNVTGTRFWTVPARCRTNLPRNMPKRNSSATASSRTASSAATSRKFSWKVAVCTSFRLRGCRRRGISHCRRINEIGNYGDKIFSYKKEPI